MSTVQKVAMTRHAKVDRIDRLAACVEHLGVGELELEIVYKGSRVRLMSSGMIFVYALHEERLITGYMGTVHRCMAMYAQSGYDRIPAPMYRVISRNEKKYRFLLDM